MGTRESKSPKLSYRTNTDCESSVASQVALIDPGSFRIIDEILQKEVKGPKKMETMAYSAVVGDDEKLE